MRSSQSDASRVFEHRMGWKFQLLAVSGLSEISRWTAAGAGREKRREREKNAEKLIGTRTAGHAGTQAEKRTDRQPTL